MSIVYAQEHYLGVDDYVAVLGETTMRSKRPLDNRERIARMISGANLVVTARENGVILGLARCVTDYAWIAYCAELAVRESAQRRGIGGGIMHKIEELLGPGIGLILIAEAEAVPFYKGLGMAWQDSAFFRTRIDRS
jgi:GNAT superfamily N-acetyltransferase